MKVLLFVCIIAFCVATSLQDTPHSRCDNGPLPQSLNVHGCDKSPCDFYKGTDVLAEWDFVVNADTKTLRPKVRATVMGVTVEYPYPEQDACKSLINNKCPLKKGDKPTYTLKMPIDKALPPVKVKLEFSLIDANDDAVVCFQLDAKIVDK